MLRFYDSDGVAQPLDNIEDFCLLRKADGSIRLSFEINAGHKFYKEIQEETKFEFEDNNYLVKKLKDGSIECDLDFDFLKENFYKNYDSGSKTLSQLLYSHLPSGWSVINGNIVTISRTTKFDYCTDYDVIMSSMNTYGVYLEWHLREKKVNVFKQNIAEITGEYVTDELNLREISYQGDSLNLITRLYAYGKDGLSFADINDGKEYIDDNRYSSRVISGYWQDDRYTDKQSLLDDATAKLADLAYPVRSYECDVVDLAKMNDKYLFLQFKLHKSVMLLDNEHKIKVQHRIVQYKEYPYEPERNVVTLSRVPTSISTSVKEISTNLKKEIAEEKTSLMAAIVDATRAITGNSGGYVVLRPEKNPQEILIMDTPDVETAQNVWRWNLSGLGHSSTGVGNVGDTEKYTVAITSDGKIVADFILAGEINGALIKGDSVQSSAISQYYKSEVTNEINSATSSVEQAFVVADEQLMSVIRSVKATLSGDVETIDRSISELRQTVENLTISYSKQTTGGINFVRNSSGLNGVSDDWSYTGTVVAEQTAEALNNTSSGSLFRLNAATLSQEITVMRGKEYTLTLKARRVTLNRSYVLINNGGNDTYIFNEQSIEGWNEHSFTFTASGDSVIIKAGTTGTAFYVADFMLVEGNQKSNWTPAPNEIYTENVRIDRRGIHITNSESSTETLIDNTQFAVKHQGDIVLTVNKDLTTLRKTEVTEELTIGKGKFVPNASGLDFVLLD